MITNKLYSTIPSRIIVGKSGGRIILVTDATLVSSSNWIHVIKTAENIILLINKTVSDRTTSITVGEKPVTIILGTYSSGADINIIILNYTLSSSNTCTVPYKVGQVLVLVTPVNLTDDYVFCNKATIDITTTNTISLDVGQNHIIFIGHDYEGNEIVKEVVVTREAYVPTYQVYYGLLNETPDDYLQASYLHTITNLSITLNAEDYKCAFIAVPNTLEVSACKDLLGFDLLDLFNNDECFTIGSLGIYTIYCICSTSNLENQFTFNLKTK